VKSIITLLQFGVGLIIQQLFWEIIVGWVFNHFAYGNEFTELHFQNFISAFLSNLTLSFEFLAREYASS
jgi:hypothetical protein